MCEVSFVFRSLRTFFAVCSVPVDEKVSDDMSAGYIFCDFSSSGCVICN